MSYFLRLDMKEIKFK